MGQLRKAFELFWSQATKIGKEKIKFAGEDHLGNRYFEEYRPHAKKVHRYFENKETKFHAIVDAAKVPPSWDAWLRFRRNEPPTKEEVAESEQYYRMQQEKATETKKKEDSERLIRSETESNNLMRSSDKTKPAKSVPKDFYEQLK